MSASVCVLHYVVLCCVVLCCVLCPCVLRSLPLSLSPSLPHPPPLSLVCVCAHVCEWVGGGRDATAPSAVTHMPRVRRVHAARDWFLPHALRRMWRCRTTIGSTSRSLGASRTLCPHPCHICTGTGLTPPTSAPGLTGLTVRPTRSPQSAAPKGREAAARDPSPRGHRGAPVRTTDSAHY